MRVLVTGRSGFTGRYVSQSLTEGGHEVVGLDADLRDDTAVDSAIAFLRPDSVIHLAALAFVNTEDNNAYYQVNQIGTFNLLSALAKINTARMIILASSGTIYGSDTSGRISENFCPKPVNHYAVSKLAMELGAKLWANRLPITVVRPFNYTGIGQEPRYLIPKIVEHFKSKANKIELGNLDVKRDFGDVRSVAAAYCSLATQTRTYDALNVATGCGYSISDIITMMSELTGHNIDICINPAFVRTNEIPYLVGDENKLRSALPQWQPHNLRDTLAWMLTE